MQMTMPCCDHVLIETLETESRWHVVKIKYHTKLDPVAPDVGIIPRTIAATWVFFIGLHDADLFLTP